MHYALLFSVFIVASCGLAYELVAGALSSYLIGDSVTQFSTVIGVYLFAMGIGSWLSRFVLNNLMQRFIQIELMVGLLGGFSAAGLFFVFAYLTEPFRFVLYFSVSLIGILVGLEIPLVMRILKEELDLRELVAQVLTFDYLGALLVSVLFPLLLAPSLGLIRTGLLFGLLNALVAAWALYLFRDRFSRFQQRALGVQCTVVVACLAVGMAFAGQFMQRAEASLYSEDIVHAETTPYQRIVLTSWRDDLRLYLNNNLQFSSRDEYRYHEALVHPALATLPGARRVLVLGGGDGLAVREILKYPSVESVTLVDLDPEMTRLFSQAEPLTRLNGGSLSSPKVRVINADALGWLDKLGDEPDGHDGAEHSQPTTFDLIVIDFPDPSNYALGKLYSTAFFRLVDKHLAPQGLIVLQATSPLYARKSYWCIVNTLEAANFSTWPYHALVPSFGEWGFVIASKSRYAPPTQYAVPLRFMTPEITPTLFVFPPDMARLPTEINRLNDQVLVRYFEEEWRHVIH